MNGEVITLENIEITTFFKIKKMIYLFVKRVFDICVSLIGIALLIPISLIIKVAYMITGDFTSIFFVQERIGKDGKMFKFYKYRTMVPDADDLLVKILKEDKKLAEEYKKNKKLKNDPRITKIGKITRKCSVDEMPQFINILLGDMSLIGNRPYLLREKVDMGDYYDDIVSTKPGLTGYWQTSGRNDVSFKRRLELEQEYSKKAGFKLDTKIFFKTFVVVICGRGAD